MNPKVSIIILNWNGWKDTVECLESLYQITYPNYDVIAVDNGSEDESIEKIKECCEGKIEVKSKFFIYNPRNKPINVIEYTKEETEIGEIQEKSITNLTSNPTLIVIKNDKNYGFPEGNNIGINFALKNLKPDYLFLLNNDTVVNKSSIEPLIAAMEEDKKIGIAGGTLCYYDGTNLIQSTGIYLNKYTKNGYSKGHGEIDVGQFNSKRDVDFISGAAMMIKRNIFEDVGLLYNNFFFLCEDVDFCLRTKKIGFKVMFIPNSKIYHKDQRSSIKIEKTTLFYSLRNKIWLAYMHGSFIEKIFFTLYYFFYTIPVTTAWSLIRVRKNYLLTIIKGTFCGFFKIKKIVRYSKDL